MTRFRLAAGGARDERLSGLAGRIIPADGPAHGKVAQTPAVHPHADRAARESGLTSHSPSREVQAVDARFAHELAVR